VLLAKEQSLSILNVLGLTRPTQAGLELMTCRLLSESASTRLQQRSQNCTNQGPGPFQRGDNHKNAKMGWDHLKIFFSQTTEPENLIFT
jgi:hypothetical protein